MWLLLLQQPRNARTFCTPPWQSISIWKAPFSEKPKPKNTIWWRDPSCNNPRICWALREAITDHRDAMMAKRVSPVQDNADIAKKWMRVWQWKSVCVHVCVRVRGCACACGCRNARERKREPLEKTFLYICEWIFVCVSLGLCNCEFAGLCVFAIVSVCLCVWRTSISMYLQLGVSVCLQAFVWIQVREYLSARKRKRGKRKS